MKKHETTLDSQYCWNCGQKKQSYDCYEGEYDRLRVLHCMNCELAEQPEYESEGVKLALTIPAKLGRISVQL